jgi:hypothetical protein
MPIPPRCGGFVRGRAKPPALPGDAVALTRAAGEGEAHARCPSPRGAGGLFAGAPNPRHCRGMRDEPGQSRARHQNGGQALKMSFLGR